MPEDIEERKYRAPNQLGFKQTVPLHYHEAVRRVEHLDQPDIEVMEVLHGDDQQVTFEAQLSRDGHPRATAKGTLTVVDQNDTAVDVTIQPAGLITIIVLEFVFTMVGIGILVLGMIFIDMATRPLISGVFFLVIAVILWRGISTFNKASGERYDDAAILSEILCERLEVK